MRLIIIITIIIITEMNSMHSIFSIMAASKSQSAWTWMQETENDAMSMEHQITRR
jgi:hypothetical protein